MRLTCTLFVFYTVLAVYIFYMKVLTVNINSKDILNKTDKLNSTQSKYFVNGIGCKVPYVSYFEPDAMALYKPMDFERCSNESDMVTPFYDIELKRYKLQINRNVANQLLNSTNSKYLCFYQEIRRNAKDDGYISARYWTFFEQDHVVPQHVQAMIVACRELYNDRRDLQTDAFTLVQYMPTVAEEKPFLRRKPSVIMLGIDSMSRMNLRRSMPRVYESLTHDGWFELQGYNKVGDNTFPNLMAILSGYTPKTAIKHICDTNEKGCLDRIPFIWKYFKNASYVTAYAEDDADISTFNYFKPGFVHQPTDYYLQPYQQAFENRLKTWKCSKCTRNYCVGRRFTSSYVYQLCLDLARRYIGEGEKRPIWGLFWTNSFSHDDFNLPLKMDQIVLDHLRSLEKLGVFEDSIVMIISDHGARFGKLMQLGSAFSEERLPAMFIYLPPWFRARYPKYAEALTINRNRLTSNYDIHNTLKHIIEIGQGQKLPKANDCPKCQSLFYPVSKQRTCQDAGIPEHYCSCERYERITGAWTKTIVRRVIERINEYLNLKNLRLWCSPLSLKRIHDVEIKGGQDLKSNVASYHVRFMVKQRNATFHATLKFNNYTKNVEVDVETISRTNSYRMDAKCIDDKIAKLYCICYSRL